MLQQLLHRLVFDVPLLTDYCKMPLRVGNDFFTFLIPLPSHILPYLFLLVDLLAWLSFSRFLFASWSFLYFSLLFSIIEPVFCLSSLLVAIYSFSLLDCQLGGEVPTATFHRLYCRCTFNVNIIGVHLFLSDTQAHSKVNISNTPTVLIICCGRSGQLQEGKQGAEVLDCVITGLLTSLLHSISLEHTREILKM